MKELIAIQNELKAPKNQYNKFGKYNYRSAEDILEALKPLLHSNGCYLVIDEDIEHVGDYTYVSSTATIYNEEDSVSSSGTAGIEKAGGMALPQAFGSASSYAKKYALGNLFLLDDTKDADATNDHNKAPKKAPQAKVATKEEIEQYVSALNASTSKESLISCWNQIPNHVKKSKEVIAKKDELKQSLT